LPTKPTGRPVGRPRAEITPAEVGKLTAIGCTDEEIAWWFGISVDTIARRKADDLEFAESYEKGKAEIRMSLRRKQLAVAKDGNATLLIWLGKQLLGQRDKFEHTGKDGGPIEVSDRRAEAARLLERVMADGISEGDARASLIALGVDERDLEPAR
jgi:hypothetical protein